MSTSFLINLRAHTTYLYCRFHDHWKMVMQKLSFLTAFMKYLETEELISREEAAKTVGGIVKTKTGLLSFGCTYHCSFVDFFPLKMWFLLLWNLKVYLAGGKIFQRDEFDLDRWMSYGSWNGFFSWILHFQLWKSSPVRQLVGCSVTKHNMK